LFSYPKRRSEDVSEVEERVRRLVDPGAFNNDAEYHATVALLRSWLTKTEMAMEDEGVDTGVIRRVLNRLVYATPDGAEAVRRLDARHQEMTRLMHDSQPWRAEWRVPNGGRT
jgi:hypothetical protein